MPVEYEDDQEKKRRKEKREMMRTNSLRKTSSVWFTSGRAVRPPTWAG